MTLRKRKEEVGEEGKERRKGWRGEGKTRRGRRIKRETREKVLDEREEIAKDKNEKRGVCRDIAL